ncbi:hypothetical protein GCM10022245_45430 [Streptomyces mayteni]
MRTDIAQEVDSGAGLDGTRTAMSAATTAEGVPGCELAEQRGKSPPGRAQDTSVEDQPSGNGINGLVALPGPNRMTPPVAGSAAIAAGHRARTE